MPFRFFAVVLGLALIGIGLLHLKEHAPPGGPRPLTVFCAAGFKTPVEALVAEFEHETGVPILLQFGGTATLLSQLQVSNQADLFIAADEDSVERAHELGLVHERLPIATQTPVVAVGEGNPKNVRGIEDLLREDLRFGVANPEASSIGKLAMRLLGDRWPDFAAAATVMKPTVNDVISDLQLGAVDAAIVWDSIVPQFEGTAALKLTPFASHSELAFAAVTGTTERPALALKLARYLAAPDRGGKHLTFFGYTPVGGDPWQSQPELAR